MTDNSEDRRNPDNGTDRSEISDEDVIELSEMTVGISAEDEAIIDLTEEIVGGAFVGCSGVSGLIDSEEQVLDLTETDADRAKASFSAAVDRVPEFEAGSVDANNAVFHPLNAVEEDIAKELDNYFHLDEDTRELPRKMPAATTTATATESVPVPVAVTPDQFEAALERVVRKAFGEKIDHILAQVIERTVADEIEALKELAVTRGAKQD